ncbi:hypothetical protein SEVIR_9G107101v4 [Setaria viridis]
MPNIYLVQGIGETASTLVCSRITTNVPGNADNIDQATYPGRILFRTCAMFVGIPCHHLSSMTLSLTEEVAVEKVKALCDGNVSTFLNDADAAGRIDQPTWHRGPRACSRGHDPCTRKSSSCPAGMAIGKAASSG